VDCKIYNADRYLVDDNSSAAYFLSAVGWLEGETGTLAACGFSQLNLLWYGVYILASRRQSTDLSGNLILKRCKIG
jgi:hypothetical protein